MYPPLNYLHGYGPAAYPVLYLNGAYTFISCAVCLIIGALLIAAILRKRDSLNSYIITRDEGGTNWIYIGTGLSAFVLFFMLVYALIVLNQVSAPPQAAGLSITVTAFQWWWKVDYDGFTTANEIHIPVGVPVLVNLRSADVIHAFWVPQLAGKTQTIPGLKNRQWIQADRPGIYRGQCTQFCGVQHAHMSFEVVAQEPGDFKKWIQEQSRPALIRQPAAQSGQKIFVNHCAACHAVRGTDADGMHGPDLTHLRSRRQIAAGTLENTPQNVMKWIANVQDIKPGARMPSFTLSHEEEENLSAFLEQLK